MLSLAWWIRASVSWLVFFFPFMVLLCILELGREGGYVSVCSCEPWGHMCLGASILCMIQDTQQEVQSQGLSRPYAQHKVSMCVMKIRN